MDRMVVLLSGGIESLVVAAMARDYDKGEGNTMLHGLFVDYGQVPRDQERRAVRAIAREYAIQLEEVEMTLPFLDGHAMLEDGSIIYANEMAKELGVKPDSRPHVQRSHVVPYRNLVFMSIAASYALSVKAPMIWAGFDYRPHLASRTADKSPEFVKALEETFRMAADDGDTAPVIVTPLQGNTKAQTIKAGERYGVKWATSWSCYNALNFPCGVCAQCCTRRAAFEEAGVDEGVEYHSVKYIRELLTNR